MEPRLAFDNVPEIYDRARMRFPPELYDDLFVYTGAPRGLRTVEIGPGTGQATGSLLERGVEVTAVEIGPRLAAFLREKFASSTGLTVVNAAFEDAALPGAAFDIVLSANAWHWVDESVRLEKARRLLRPGATLALISANQVGSDVDRGYFERTFPIYRRYRPDEQPTEPQGEDIVPPEYGEVESSGRFRDVMLRRYRCDQTYYTEAYLDLVRSYSNTQTMEPGPREALISDLRHVIDAEYDGRVVRPMVVTLTLGRPA